MSPRLPRLSTHVLNLVLIVLLAWQLAHWTWLFLAPRLPLAAPAVRAELNSEVLLETIRAARLFSGGASENLSASAATTPLNIKLKGVFAASGKRPAMAIIDTGEKSNSAFSIGDTVLPDVVLEEVHAHHVILKRGGMRERLALEQKQLPQDAILVHSKYGSLPSRHSRPQTERPSP